MIHTGPAHTADMSALYFPDERVVFAVDPPDVSVAPLSFGPYSPHGVARWLDAVSPLEFDLLALDDGSTTRPTDLRLLKAYVDDLIAAVTAGVGSGRTLSQLHAEVLLPTHRSNPRYGARLAQIDEVYRALSVHQWNLYFAAAVTQLSTNTTYCSGYATCHTFGRTLPAGSIGLGYSWGRYRFVSEFSTGRQLLASRSSRFYDDSLANRRSKVSFLVGYPAAAGVLSIEAVGGAAILTSDTRGLNRVKEAEVPVGGRHPIVSRLGGVGSVVGADVSLSLGPRWSLRFPIRFTFGSIDDGELHPGSRDVHVGVGLRYRLTQRVVRLSGKPQPVVMRGGGASAQP
jgi:hypothetical protein